MLGPVQQSILFSQGSFLRGVNYNNIGRFGLAATVNILCSDLIASMIDRVENRLQKVEEGKKFPRKVIAFSSFTLLLNVVQVKILFGARVGLIASLAIIVTLTALMTLKYIYDKTKEHSSPLPKPPESTVNPSPSDEERHPPSLPISDNNGHDRDVAVSPPPIGPLREPNPQPNPPSPPQERSNPPNLPREQSNPPLASNRNHSGHHPSASSHPYSEHNHSVTSSSSNPPRSNYLNISQGPPLMLSLLPTLQKPIRENILTEEQYRTLENALHCSRETLNYLFVGLEADQNLVRKEIVFKELHRRVDRFANLLSSRDYLPEGQNREGPYLDENMKKLFVHYIEEFMRRSENRERLKYPERYKPVVQYMMDRVPEDKSLGLLMHRLFSHNDDEVYAACHYADNCAYTSEELREFVRWFTPNPTPDQAFAILFPLHQAGRIIQKHQGEPERLGKTPSDPGLKNRVMNGIKSYVRTRIYQRPQRGEITVLEFKEIFAEFAKDYQLFQGTSHRFISMMQP
jgi:hypothetical protein